MTITQALALYIFLINIPNVKNPILTTSNIAVVHDGNSSSHAGLKLCLCKNTHSTVRDIEITVLGNRQGHTDQYHLSTDLQYHLSTDLQYHLSTVLLVFFVIGRFAREVEPLDSRTFRPEGQPRDREKGLTGKVKREGSRITSVATAAPRTLQREKGRRLGHCNCFEHIVPAGRGKVPTYNGATEGKRSSRGKP
eukprot:g7095.t1